MERELTEADALRALQLVKFAALSITAAQTSTDGWRQAMQFSIGIAQKVEAKVGEELRALAKELWPTG
jgi:hypothetical protein